MPADTAACLALGLYRARAVQSWMAISVATGAILLSPVHGDPALPRRIAEWLLEDRLPARLQLQLHKVIWDASERGR